MRALAFAVQQSCRPASAAVLLRARSDQLSRGACEDAVLQQPWGVACEFLAAAASLGAVPLCSLHSLSCAKATGKRIRTVQHPGFAGVDNRSISCR